jgi:glutamate-1-semialdehyde aminotransferase
VAIHATKKKPIKDARVRAESDQELSKKLFRHLLESQILMLLPEMLHAAIGYAHTGEDVKRLTSTVEEFVKGYRVRDA